MVFKPGIEKIKTLPNVLTSKEKLQIPKLIGHDTIGNLSRAYAIFERIAHPERYPSISNLEEIGKINVDSVVKIERCIEALTQSEEIYTKRIKTTYFSAGFPYLFEQMADNLEIGLDCPESFISNEDILHSVLINLIRNAWKNICEGDKIKLSASQNEFPSRALYIPVGAREYQKFIRFSVQNPGEFPRDKPLIDRIRVCPPRGRNGFGLYFTGLAAKVLRAPVDIKSENGVVDVSFYQPVYPIEEKR